jgi:hypothetical protein
MSYPTIKGVDHIYVICHLDKEKDKYSKWLKWMEVNKVKPDYLTFYCYKWGTELTLEDLNKYSIDDGTLTRLFPFRKPFPLKPSEISLGINFLNVYKMGLEMKYKNILVFESDAILHPNFMMLMNKINEDELTKYTDWDIFSLGCGMNKHYPNIFKNKHIYRAKEIRCADSLIISNRGMQKLVDSILILKLPIDEHYDLLIKDNSIVILWLEPTLVLQGSQIGLNPTTIRYSNSIYVNPHEYKWLDKAIK